MTEPFVGGVTTNPPPLSFIGGSPRFDDLLSPSKRIGSRNRRYSRSWRLGGGTTEATTSTSSPTAMQSSETACWSDSNDCGVHGDSPSGFKGRIWPSTQSLPQWASAEVNGETRLLRHRAANGTAQHFRRKWATRNLLLRPGVHGGTHGILNQALTPAWATLMNKILAFSSRTSQSKATLNQRKPDLKLDIASISPACQAIAVHGAPRSFESSTLLNDPDSPAHHLLPLLLPPALNRFIAEHATTNRLCESIVKGDMAHGRVNRLEFLRLLYYEVAVTTIQKYVRGYLTRKKFAILKKQAEIDRLRHTAATKIQAVWRGYCGRWEAKLRTHIKTHEICRQGAARKIQGAWRCWKARQELQVRTLADMMWRARQISAATIQKAWRGYKVRKIVDEEWDNWVIKWIWDPPGKVVEVVGDFTNPPWLVHHRMTWCAVRRCYVAVLPRRQGRYELKFAVEGRFVCCGAGTVVEDGTGHYNNVVDVFEAQPESPFRRGRAILRQMAESRKRAQKNTGGGPSTEQSEQPPQEGLVSPEPTRFTQGAAMVAVESTSTLEKEGSLGSVTPLQRMSGKDEGSNPPYCDMSSPRDDYTCHQPPDWAKALTVSAPYVSPSETVIVATPMLDDQQETQDLLPKLTPISYVPISYTQETEVYGQHATEIVSHPATPEYTHLVTESYTRPVPEAYTNPDSEYTNLTYTGTDYPEDTSARENVEVFAQQDSGFTHSDTSYTRQPDASYTDTSFTHPDTSYTRQSDASFTQPDFAHQSDPSYVETIYPLTTYTQPETDYTVQQDYADTSYTFAQPVAVHLPDPVAQFTQPVAQYAQPLYGAKTSSPHSSHTSPPGLTQPSLSSPAPPSPEEYSPSFSNRACSDELTYTFGQPDFGEYAKYQDPSNIPHHDESDRVSSFNTVEEEADDVLTPTLHQQYTDYPPGFGTPYFSRCAFDDVVIAGPSVDPVALTRSVADDRGGDRRRLHFLNASTLDIGVEEGSQSMAPHNFDESFYREQHFYEDALSTLKDEWSGPTVFPGSLEDTHVVISDDQTVEDVPSSLKSPESDLFQLTSEDALGLEEQSSELASYTRSLTSEYERSNEFDNGQKSNILASESYSAPVEDDSTLYGSCQSMEAEGTVEMVDGYPEVTTLNSPHGSKAPSVRFIHPARRPKPAGEKLTSVRLSSIQQSPDNGLKAQLHLLSPPENS
eukprot:Blabericola_migrator_1__7747@NODE_395_length_8977_cov_183_416835_g72_i1_p1_GENE_NODE_395_length_8977_cov_183_416835_g72_i1NODE_395_length_8977_cov_183_416835_g72_i1_p1_ORF_typecomplete_len1390_score154_34IQ/PF00612_27/1_6e05IQ/PF00612_27/0_00042IQ/PF00612_27/0_47IQ/PF00612_27/0_0016AMPK1_CBM/PF16561_5/1_8e03AMPK1_CBM/PF16561_5/2e09_NODE_395_length_8977_cov_183_416835_g72_i16004172